MVRDLSIGNPLKRIFGFCVPLLIGNLFQQLYSMADSVIVGKYLGVDAFAAVGSTGSLNLLILGFALGLCSGVCIPIAQHFGAGNIKELRRCVAHGIYIAIAVSVFIGGLMTIFTRPVLILLGTPANILDDACAYLIVIFAGTGITILYNLLAGYMRALGDSSTPFLILVIACLCNIGLDLLFIAVFHMGVAGAALATLVSQLVSVFLCIRAIFKRFPVLRFTRKDAKPSWRIIGGLLRISVPLGLQSSIIAVGSIVLQSAINGLGSAAVAAMYAGGKVQSMLTVPMESLGITMAIFVGQNYGAGHIDRVKKGVSQALLICLAYAAVALSLGLILGPNIAEIFLDRSEVALHALVNQFLTIQGYFYGFLGVLYVYRNALQGIGYIKSAMCAGFLETAGRVAVSVLFVSTYGFVATCFAGPAAWALGSVFVMPMYLQAIRKMEKKAKLQPETQK